VSQRREALIARYRVLSIERIRVIRSRLEAVAAGDPEVLAEVKRELHTLKGDSHLLGFVRLGEVAHACEERLEDPLGLDAAAHALADALDAVRTALRDETTARSVLDEGLKPTLDALLAATTTAPAPPAEAPGAREVAPATQVPAPPAPPAAEPRPAAEPVPVAKPAAEPTPVAEPTLVAERKPIAVTKPIAAPKPPAEPTPGEPKPAPVPVPQPSQGDMRWIHVSAHDVDLVCERLSALHADLGRIHAALRSIASTSRDTMHDVERLRADLDEIVSSAWALRLAPVYPTLAELGEHALDRPGPWQAAERPDR
jgi:chemotaxis protein histidine kinase CheA